MGSNKQTMTTSSGKGKEDVLQKLWMQQKDSNRDLFVIIIESAQTHLIENTNHHVTD